MILTPEQIAEHRMVHADPDDIDDLLEECADIYDTLLAYAEIVQRVAFTQCDGLYAAHGMEGRYTIDVETVLAARKLRGLDTP